MAWLKKTEIMDVFIKIAILFDLSNKKIFLQSKINDQLCIGH